MHYNNIRYIYISLIPRHANNIIILRLYYFRINSLSFRVSAHWKMSGCGLLRDYFIIHDIDNTVIEEDDQVYI